MHERTLLVTIEVTWCARFEQVIVGGWMHKNFLASPGHKHTSSTLGLFAPTGMHDSGPGDLNYDPANYESLTNSTILMPLGGQYLIVPSCSPDEEKYALTRDNRIYTGSNATVTIVCGGKKDPDPQQKTFTLQEWQAAGHDDGTTLTREMPDDATIEHLVRAWLQF